MNSSNTVTVCFHCGSDCDEHPVKNEEKNFCCEGCKTVYEILAENGLEKFYELEVTPGKSMNDINRSGKYDYLDDDLLQSQFLDFKSASLSKVTLRLPQIHCSSCVWLLENLYKLHEGVKECRVNFMRQKATIDFNPEEIPLKTLVALLASIGYEPDIKLEDTENKKTPIDKKLWYKLGIAGFCFGNIMFLSLPEYFSSAGYLKNFLGGMLGYLNIALGLPVLFYSATDYFTAAWHGLKQKHLSIDVPISLGIITLFLVSLYEILSGTGVGYFDSLSGLIFFLLLGRVFQQKSYQTLSFDRSYKSYFPLSVTKLVNDNEQSIALQHLKKGDQIVVRNGELIPADTMLLTSNTQVDYSFVTGESKPVTIVAGEIVYAGGRLVGESAKMEVIKSVSQSYLVELWNNEAFGKQKRNSLQDFSNEISKSFTIIILMIAIVSAVFWLFTDAGLALKVFTSVLIVACPCALALSIPFVYGNAIRIMAHHHFYARNIGVIDAINHVKSIVFDKTGTLTDTAVSTITFVGEPLSLKNQGLIKAVVKQSSHPLSRKIAKRIGGPDFVANDFKEILGQGLKAYVNDHLIVLGNGAFVMNDLQKSYPSGVHIKIDGEYLGYFKIYNQLRTGTSTMLNALKEDYALYVLSGDKELEKETFQQMVGDNVKLYFEQMPYDKLEKIADFQHHLSVMMLGDGLNDAGALKQSDVGIAVTDDVSYFTPASDAILLGKELPNLNRFISFAKASRKLVIASFVISFLYNIVGLFFAIQGNLSPIIAAILMPVSSISVVAFAFLSTYFVSKKYFGSL